MTFVIIGAGPTGVEMAGALAEIARHSLPGDFRSIDPSKAGWSWSRALPRVLPAYPETLSAKARASWSGWGWRCGPATAVTAIDAEGVDLGDERLPRAHRALGGRGGGLAAGRARWACRSTAPAGCWWSRT